jgi:23S rRNA (pseudouridine1915-N3)-methyltransferase
MKITIAAIGKFKASPEKEIFTSYIKRIPWQVELKEFEAKKALLGRQLKDAEAALLISAIPKNSKIIALDERGKNIPSMELAALISAWQGEGTSSVAFVIGGADGLSDEVRGRADFTLSFGRLTWPHMLVRSMLAEQVYRIYTIISKHPYHRE